MPSNSSTSYLYGLNQISQAAQWARDRAGKHKIWCFKGEMGQGKTTLIKEICKQWGVLGEITSPSFSIVNEYANAQGEVIFHFDFYRIKSLEEVYDLGIETYFNGRNICLVEWPEKIGSLLEEENPVVFSIESAQDIREIKVINNLV